ncbi:hypothetical protein BOX15_Mlig019060g1 [Macrostomum lignano]|uniref:C2 domain-containing protein n=1 Tax=Macrostomum lignano TaxID=282301 RepID=A0A267EB85_9PLAT|nr:hypothetical protein BOX15_Mlig019060g1 [Macrostomum lignano]
MENYRFDGGPQVLHLGRRVEIPVPLPTLMYRGDIMLALRYVSGELIKANQLARDDSNSKVEHNDRKPVGGRLEVWVQNCRNLAGSGSGASPYVKGYLINPDPDSRATRSSRVKQKSAIVKGDMNPNFNSILAFENISLRDLKGRSLELTVWDHVKIGRNDFLGGVRLNVGTAATPAWTLVATSR